VLGRSAGRRIRTLFESFTFTHPRRLVKLACDLLATLHLHWLPIPIEDGRLQASLPYINVAAVANGSPRRIQSCGWHHGGTTLVAPPTERLVRWLWRCLQDTLVHQRHVLSPELWWLEGLERRLIRHAGGAGEEHESRQRDEDLSLTTADLDSHYSG
jgi:hypothetical protein